MRYDYLDYSLNRVLCNVLDDMRKLDECRNYSGLKGLIEEAQIMGNKMEAALYDKKDLRKAKEELDVLKIEIKALRKEKEELTKQLGKEKEND